MDIRHIKQQLTITYLIVVIAIFANNVIIIRWPICTQCHNPHVDNQWSWHVMASLAIYYVQWSIAMSAPLTSSDLLHRAYKVNGVKQVFHNPLSSALLKLKVLDYLASILWICRCWQHWSSPQSNNLVTPLIHIIQWTWMKCCLHFMA